MWFYNIKATFKCKKCGEKRIPCLDFHHRAPSKKERSVANMVCNSSKARILKEIKKCDVLCKNCHAILHSKDVRNKFIIAL